MLPLSSKGNTFIAGQGNQRLSPALTNKSGLFYSSFKNCVQTNKYLFRHRNFFMLGKQARHFVKFLLALFIINPLKYKSRTRHNRYRFYSFALLTPCFFLDFYFSLLNFVIQTTFRLSTLFSIKQIFTLQAYFLRRTFQ